MVECISAKCAVKYCRVRIDNATCSGHQGALFYCLVQRAAQIIKILDQEMELCDKYIELGHRSSGCPCNDRNPIGGQVRNYIWFAISGSRRINGNCTNITVYSSGPFYNSLLLIRFCRQMPRCIVKRSGTTYITPGVLFGALSH